MHETSVNIVIRQSKLCSSFSFILFHGHPREETFTENEMADDDDIEGEAVQLSLVESIFWHGDCSVEAIFSHGFFKFESRGHCVHDTPHMRPDQSLQNHPLHS